MSISTSQSPFNYSLPFLWLAAPCSRESWGEVMVGYKPGKPSFWEGFNGFHVVYFCFLSKCTLRTQGEQLNSQSSAWYESLLLFIFFPLKKLPLSLCPPGVLPSLCSACLLSCENQRSSHKQREQGPEQVLCWWWAGQGAVGSVRCPQGASPPHVSRLPLPSPVSSVFRARPASMTHGPSTGARCQLSLVPRS